MSFILLEIAMQAVASCDAIGPDLSDAPEIQRTGYPKCRTGAATDAKCKARSRTLPMRARESARTTPRPVTKGAPLEEKESN
jgi:hypothetical protein